jgi:hypothetical protein
VHADRAKWATLGAQGLLGPIVQRDPVVGEYRREPVPQAIRGQVRHVAHEFPCTVDLRRRDLDGEILEDVNTRIEYAMHQRIGAVELEIVQRMPISDEHPGGVVLRWSHFSLECFDRLVGGLGRGKEKGKLSTGPSSRVPTKSRRAIREAGDYPVLVDGEPGPARKLIATAENTRSVLAKNGDRGRGSVQPFVSVGRDHERKARDDARTDDEQAHRLPF